MSETQILEVLKRLKSIDEYLKQIARNTMRPSTVLLDIEETPGKPHITQGMSENGVG